MLFPPPESVLGSEEVLIALALLVVAALYSSVGHGGASGYLAILSLTSFASMEDLWLKQHAWILNLIVAAIAFYHYQRAGHHVPSMTRIFILASIPMAFAGGYLLVEGVVVVVTVPVVVVCLVGQWSAPSEGAIAATVRLPRVALTRRGESAPSGR